jgi:hypothetical protein
MLNKKAIGFLIIVSIILVVLYQCFNTTPVEEISKISSVSIGTDIVINVEVADTPEKKSKGLAGREHLSDSEGMLFPFTESNHMAVFWMKGMLIPIDMIWIKNGAIVQIDRNAQPEPGTSDFQLTLYSPSTPVDYVLEVRGGLSDEKGFKEGDLVTVNE